MTVCAVCRETMADGPETRCFTCIAGPDASRTSVGALEAYRRGLAARGARKPRETDAVLRQRAGSPRRHPPTARELLEQGLDQTERSEVRTKGEEVIRSEMLS